MHAYGNKITTINTSVVVPTIKLPHGTKTNLIKSYTL